LKWIPIKAALGIDISPIFDQESNYFDVLSCKWIPIFAALGIDISAIVN
jgi:hypothetical protein